MNNWSAVPVQLYHTTLPSALEWSAMRAPPAGPMWSLLGPITPRHRGCGWTCQTGGKAFRLALWRDVRFTVQMWGSWKRWRWAKAFKVWVRIMHPHAYTHSSACTQIQPILLEVIVLPLPAARPWWSHSRKLLARWWAGRCCANQRGQIYLCLQVLAGQRPRRWLDC